MTKLYDALLASRLSNLCVQIQESYEADTRTMSSWGSNLEEEQDLSRNKMIEEFRSGLSITKGSKYLKIVTGNSVWGFVQRNTCEKFEGGDILMAKSWNSPATNFARGNVFAKNNKVRWTGAC
jgi:hypothetical protein